MALDPKRFPFKSSFICVLTKNGFINLRLNAEDYFNSLKNYKFIISPEGNGIDCHRHYEALLSGCIPICEYNKKTEEDILTNIKLMFNKNDQKKIHFQKLGRTQRITKLLLLK